MKKLTITILLIIYSLTIFSQDIQLQISVDEKCTGQDIVGFTLRKDSGIVIDYTMITEPVIYELIDTGTYYFYQLHDLYPYHMIHITKPGFYNVKINPKIVSFESWSRDPPMLLYLCCGTPCDGSVVDFYPNGQIRIKGTFVKGQRTGWFTEYYLNGNLMGRHYFPKGNKRKGLSERYNLKGVMKSCSNRYRWGYTMKEYDDNGEVILKYRYRREVSTTIYYKLGQPIRKVIEGKKTREYRYVNKKWIQIKIDT